MALAAAERGLFALGMCLGGWRWLCGDRELSLGLSPSLALSPSPSAPCHRALTAPQGFHPSPAPASITASQLQLLSALREGNSPVPAPGCCAGRFQPCFLSFSVFQTRKSIELQRLLKRIHHRFLNAVDHKRCEVLNQQVLKLVFYRKIHLFFRPFLVCSLVSLLALTPAGLCCPCGLTAGGHTNVTTSGFSS